MDLWEVKWNHVKRNIASLTTSHKNTEKLRRVVIPVRKEFRSSVLGLKLLPFLCIFLSHFSLPTIVVQFQTYCYERNQGSIPSPGKRFFSSSQLPDRFWGSPTVLSKRYHRFFFGNKGAGVQSWSTHFHLTPGWRFMELYLHFPYIIG
jgi:hypothetical protein